MLLITTSKSEIAVYKTQCNLQWSEIPRVGGKPTSSQGTYKIVAGLHISTRLEPVHMAVSIPRSHACLHTHIPSTLFIVQGHNLNTLKVFRAPWYRCLRSVIEACFVRRNADRCEDTARRTYLDKYCGGRHRAEPHLRFSDIHFWVSTKEGCFTERTRVIGVGQIASGQFQDVSITEMFQSGGEKCLFYRKSHFMSIAS